MKRVAQNAVFAGIGQAIAKSALLLLILAVANVLGVAALGEAMTGFTLATFLRNFLDWGLGKVAVRHVSRNPGDAGAFLASAFRSKRGLFAVGLFGYAAACVGFVSISETPVDMAVFLVLMGMNQVVGIISLSRGYVFNGLERMDFETLSLAARQGTMLLVFAALILTGWGISAIGFGVAAGELAGVLVTGRLLRRLGIGAAPGDAARAAAIRRAGNPIVASVVFGLVYAYGSTLILRTFLGPEETGLFNAPYRMVLEFQVVPAILGVAVFPVFSRLGNVDRGDLSGLLARGRKSAIAIMTVGIGGALCLSLFAREALSVLYWKQPAFWEMDAMLSVLAWVIPVTCLNILLGDMIYALDGERLAVWIAAGVATASLAANFFAIPRYGIWGACWTTIGAESLFLVCDIVVLRMLLVRARRRGKAT